jgi:hypothetical protein
MPWNEREIDVAPFAATGVNIGVANSRPVNGDLNIISAHIAPLETPGNELLFFGHYGISTNVHHLLSSATCGVPHYVLVLLGLGDDHH